MEGLPPLPSVRRICHTHMANVPFLRQFAKKYSAQAAKNTKDTKNIAKAGFPFANSDNMPAGMAAAQDTAPTSKLS